MSNWQFISIGSDNGFALNRQQAIVWNNGGIVYGCIMCLNQWSIVWLLWVWSLNYLPLSGPRCSDLTLALRWLNKMAFSLHQEILPTYSGPAIITLYPGPLILAWINNYFHHKMWVEIIYPFPNLSGAAAEVWEWISNFIAHFTGHVITYPWWE